MRAGLALEPLYDEMMRQILNSNNVFVDETPIDMLDPGKGKVHKAFMWVLCGGIERDPPYRVYEFYTDRKHANAEKLLGDYRGVVHSDKYGAYEALANAKKIIWCPCWTHIRRKFFEAESGDPKFRDWVLRKIRYLFMFEKVAWARSEDERLRIRLEKEVPIIDELILAIKGKLVDGKPLPKSKYREALGYFCALIPYLKNYKTHPIDSLRNHKDYKELSEIVPLIAESNPYRLEVFKVLVPQGYCLTEAERAANLFVKGEFSKVEQFNALEVYAALVNQGRAFTSAVKALDEDTFKDALNRDYRFLDLCLALSKKIHLFDSGDFVKRAGSFAYGAFPFAVPSSPKNPRELERALIGMDMYKNLVLHNVDLTMANNKAIEFQRDANPELASVALELKELVQLQSAILETKTELALNQFFKHHVAKESLLREVTDLITREGSQDEVQQLAAHCAQSDNVVLLRLATYIYKAISMQDL